MAVAAEANPFANMRIPEINRLGTEALKSAVQIELQERELWDDPEVRWAFDFSMRMHEHDTRCDGSYQNHLLRTAMWGVREFDTRNAELAKLLLLHDVVEDHAPEILREFGAGLQLGGPLRDQAIVALSESGQLSRSATVAALEHISYPSLEGATSLEHRQRYARFVSQVTLADPLSAAGKIADRIDNRNGNKYNPNPKLQRRLDIKYFVDNHLLREAVYARGSLIPDHRKDFIDAALVNGHEEAKERLMRPTPLEPALSGEQVEALTLESLLAA
ncbi:MAG TPA: hypothetical protein VLG11_03100 [Candidatus Saccharimonadales bacterium]|nr:hypothetical protein [Candidatus Saccharimonadales bacterium]